MTPRPRRVVIEHPYFAPPDRPALRARNDAYAAACIRDSLNRGEAPFASAPLYAATKAYDDHDPVERARGIAAGFAWREVADLTAVYVDLGISSGMERGIADALRIGQPIERRTVPGWT